MTREPFQDSKWIWGPDKEESHNRWIEFRRKITWIEAGRPSDGGNLILNLTADSRYQLWINNIWQGEGPVRSWPDELFYDSYDITSAALAEEECEIRLLVHHYYPGTSYYITGEAGCAVELLYRKEGKDEVKIVSDDKWLCADHPGFQEPVVKISNGLGYGEVFRNDLAVQSSLWDWNPVFVKGPALSNNRKIGYRDIPALEEETLAPAGILGQRTAVSRGFIRSVNLRLLVYPGDTDINKHKRFSGIIETDIFCPDGGVGEIGITLDPHDTEQVVFFLEEAQYAHINGTCFPAEFSRGRNRLRILVRGEYHDPVFHIQFVLPEGACLKSPLGDGNESPFCFTGPLTRSSHIQVSEPIPPAEEEVLSEGELRDIAFEIKSSKEKKRIIPGCYVSPHHVALECLTSRAVDLSDEEFLQQRDAEPVDFPFAMEWNKGERREVLWDFGREVSGFLEFDITGTAGTGLDFFCFESVHDGMIEHAYSLNNSMRYICAEGRQIYLSAFRRGFRYVMIIADSGSGEAVLNRLSLKEKLYTTANSGSFTCSDEVLNHIWEISARTVSLCMEDTYVDCPAYEQTYWTGDARNTALYSYYLYNGGPLFLRGAKLAARSLERSPLIESTIPSSWQNVIPAWSFFHVIAGCEYLSLWGDQGGFEDIYPSLFKNMENAADRRVVLPDGRKLFALHAWNMLDWAPMDVPDEGIIAHQNAQFVIACNLLADGAKQIGRGDEAEKLRAWADEVKEAVAIWFWNEEKGAFFDSLSRDFIPSAVYSVQTQVFIYLAGILSEKKQQILKELILNPPEGFVRIGNPFVRHFYFELLYRWGSSDEIIGEIRKTWGEMVEHDATTCWEGWKLIPGHYTRSHCHAWSAAPVYFLPSITLGISPMGQGFEHVRISPHTGDLKWAKGSVTTPLGLLDVSWEIKNGRIDIDIVKPENMEISIELSEGDEPGEWNINDRK